MARVNWQDIGELTKVDQSGINKAIVIPAKEALRQTRLALGGNLTIRDNMYAADVTFSLTSGVEYTFQNPLKTTPVGFTPIKCVDANGVALNIGNVALNTTRTDGLMGITVGFSSSLTGYVGETVSSYLSPSSALTVSNSVTANLTSITATQGEWNVNTMTVLGFGSSVTMTQLAAGMSLTSATMSLNGDLFASSALQPTSSADSIVTIPPRKFSFTATTAVFSVVRVVFSNGVPRAFGRIEACRASLTNNGQIANVTGILWGG